MGEGEGFGLWGFGWYGEEFFLWSRQRIMEERLRRHLRWYQNVKQVKPNPTKIYWEYPSKRSHHQTSTKRNNEIL